MKAQRPAPTRPASRVGLAMAAATDPAQVSDRAVDRTALARDASHFLLTPQAVVVARHAPDVAAVMRAAAGLGVPVTFRSGGTSLSGQASTSGVLVDTRRSFRAVEVLDDGVRVRCQPGATVRSVNAHLAGYNRAIGPDPASESACTVGGVVANNSSGMACGTEYNSYRTCESVVVVLPSGTTIDTAGPGADNRLATLEPELHRGLALLRDRVRSDPRSMAVINHQFSMKNTMGYSVNAFVDADRPVDILTRLMVGSEGTLGFIASATFATVPVLRHAATELLVFPEIGHATDAIEALLGAGARTLELMDARSLRVAQRGPRVDPALAALNVDRHTALLVEARAQTATDLTAAIDDLQRATGALPLATPAAFSTDAVRRASLWTTRKGLYAAVAGARPLGTTALLEDVAVPVPNLTATTTALSGLLDSYGHGDAVIFGHAKDGNLHFMINPRFDEPAQVRRYERFTDDLVDLVLSRHGTLKAEHGTGRMMAPYLRRQYGDELYQVMCEVKRLFDPAGVLNPGIIINDDPRVHVRDLKVSPVVEPVGDSVHSGVDRCVDCGYCEPVCPSRDVTTTPRQRIALLRGIAAAAARGDLAQREELADDYGYAAIDSCAADSLCLTACPVGIDTGAAMKGLRAERHGASARGAGAAAARHWGPVISGVRGGLGVASPLPAGVLTAVSGLARDVLGADRVPLAGDDLPGPGARRVAASPPGAGVVLFASCVGSMFGGDGSGAFVRLAERAGVAVAVPEGIGGLCCGTPWASKGLHEGYQQMAAATFGAIWQASRGGALPVACEASSCSHGLVQLLLAVPDRLRERADRIQVVDSVTFVARDVLPRLSLRPRLGAVALHPTCSTVHLDAGADLRTVADACAEEVVVPLAWGCCGFAGDRGMLHPELTASATAAQAAELAGREFDAYVSSNRTCEMGMSRATGKSYIHVLELLERQSRH